MRLVSAWVLAFGLLAAPVALYAEQCTAGVYAMAPWARSIGGNADDWPANAVKLGFRVDQTPENGAVIVYPPSYGRRINPKYGHVAVLVDVRPDRNGQILVKDSNGICGGDRRQCRARMPVWKFVFVIHPKAAK